MPLDPCNRYGGRFDCNSNLLNSRALRLYGIHGVHSQIDLTKQRSGTLADLPHGFFAISSLLSTACCCAQSGAKLEYAAVIATLLRHTGN